MIKKRIGGNKMVKKIPLQMSALNDIINVLLRIYKKNNLENIFYEKSVTHEFYHLLKNKNKQYNIIAEFPVKRILKNTNENQRFDFYLKSKENKNFNQDIIVEIKKGSYNYQDILEDFTKMKPLKKLAYHKQYQLGILPLFINFFTEELNFERYKKNIDELYSNWAINLITVCPKIRSNDIHLKGHLVKTQHNINRPCIITNYQRILDFGLYPLNTPVIIHKKGGTKARIKNLILYDNQRFAEIVYLDPY